MKTRVIVNEGFASSFLDFFYPSGSKTVAKNVRKITSDMDLLGFTEIHSTRILSRRKLKETALKEDTNNFLKKNLLIVGKSMGAVENYDFMMNNWEAISSCYNKIAWVTIDGHSKLFKELFENPYGKNRSFVRDKRMLGNSKIRIYNVFQQESYPEGAYFVGANENKKLDNVDHFRIIDDEETLCMIAMAREFLKEN